MILWLYCQFIHLKMSIVSIYPQVGNRPRKTAQDKSIISRVEDPLYILLSLNRIDLKVETQAFKEPKSLPRQNGVTGNEREEVEVREVNLEGCHTSLTESSTNGTEKQKH